MSLDLIDKIVVLNVDSRLDNFAPIKKQWREYGYTGEIKQFIVGKGSLYGKVKYDRIDEDAVSPIWKRGPFSALPNSYHAFKSYQTIIGQAYRERLRNVLLLEDDVEFLPNFLEVFNQACLDMREKHAYAEMLYLGANHTWAKTREITPNLLQINGSVCWHAVWIAASLFETILSWTPDRPIDDMAKFLHGSGKCYALWPNVAVQKPGFSNVEGKDRDYSSFWSNKGQQW